MRDAQGEEFKHFSMDLEFLLRRTPLWREIARASCFSRVTSSSMARPREAHATGESEPDEGLGGDNRSGSLGIGGDAGSVR